MFAPASYQLPNLFAGEPIHTRAGKTSDDGAKNPGTDLIMSRLSAE
jgi:hypothetical protein